MSDRLLTKAQKPWDPVANKNVLVDLPTAQLIVGYAGAAYIQNKPTDEWLLETINDRPLPKPLPGLGVPNSLLSQKIKPEQVFARIHEAVDRDFPTYKHSGKPGAASEVEVAPRRPWLAGVPTGFALVSIGDSSPATDEVFDHVRDWWAPGGQRPLDSLEALLADEVRRVAASVPTVGTDLMSIRLPMTEPPSVRYLRDTSRAEAVWAYTPAYVCSGMINLATMFNREGFRYGSGGYISGGDEKPWVVTFEAVPPMPHAGIAMAQPQPRPPTDKP